MFCSIRIPYPYAYHCWSALMTGFLSITFSSLDRFMYYTTVRCCFISLCSKPFKDRFIYPVLCRSAFPLAKEPSRRSAFVLSDAPFFGVGTAKVVTYFLLTKFAVRKVPLPRLIHPPLPLSQPALRHAWQNPYFWVATAKVITYFLLTKSFGKILLFLRRFFPLYPYNKQIFFRSNCQKIPAEPLVRKIRIGFPDWDKEAVGYYPTPLSAPEPSRSRLSRYPSFRLRLQR